MFGPPGRTTTRRHVIRGALTAAALMAAAACVPDGGGTPTTTTTTSTTTSTTSTTTSTTTTTVPVDPYAVSGVQLTWAYSQYAQYGVFGAWSQVATGPNVQVNELDGLAVSGDPVDSGKTFTQVQFDNGVGSINPTTGEGTVTWDTGDWVLNAYNGQFGAPDETLRDPVLTIGANGAGTLSFEAYIPAALDMNGNPAPAAGPQRIAIATFDNIDELTAGSLSTKPDFAGRSFTPVLGSPWMDCAGVGGAWPSEWINFVPMSVQAHYYTTSCSGLNLKKPPVAFDVSWTPSAAAITRQPTLSNASVLAGTKLSTLGAKVAVSGVPTPAVQWQRSFDGVTWTDVPGATSTKFLVPVLGADNGASFRAVVGAGQIASDVIGPVTVTEQATGIIDISPNEVIVGRGEATSVGVVATGAPVPTVQWERSEDGGATWNDVATTTSTLGTAQVQSMVLISPATDADNGDIYRARANNGVAPGTDVLSAPITISVRFDVPTIVTNPADRITFPGLAVTFEAAANAIPNPTYQWEYSTDGGATYQDWTSTTSPGTSPTLTIVAADVTAGLDNAKFRMRAQNAAGASHTTAATLRVHTALGNKQVIVAPTGPIDPTQPVTLQVIGSGFAPPTSITSAMRLVVTDTTKWQPGANGSTVGALGNLSLSAASLRTTGMFWRQITVPANAWNMSLSYGVGTFANTATERFYDTWSPLTLTIP